jgi:hypothetical protein
MKKFLYEWILCSVILLLFLFSSLVFGYWNKWGDCYVVTEALALVWLYFLAPGLYFLLVFEKLGIISDYLSYVDDLWIGIVTVGLFLYGGIIPGINRTADALNRRKQRLRLQELKR